MRKYRFLLVVFLLVMVLIPKELFAGAWTVQKHHVWMEVYTKYAWAKEYFNPDGGKTTSKNHAWWQEVDVEPKIEFGFYDFLTLLGSVSWFKASYEEYDRSPNDGSYYVKNNGLKSVTCGGRLRIVQNPAVVSLQLKGYIWPGYDSSKPPSPGFGNDGLELRALLGKKFNFPVTPKCILPIYYNMETGYRWNNLNVADDVPIFVEGGFWPVSWFLIKGEIDSYFSTPNDQMKNNYAIWRVGGNWQILGGDSVERQGILFNFECQYGQTFWGKSTNAAQEITWKFQTQF